MPDPQERLKSTRDIHAAILRMTYASPFDAAAAMMGELSTSQDLHNTAIVTNHFGMTMANRIRQNRSQEEEEEELTPEQTARASNIIHCATAISVIRQWAKECPEEAQSLEDALMSFIQHHKLEEEDFNARLPMDNVQAVETASASQQPQTEGINPPPSTRYALMNIRDASRELIDSSHESARAGGRKKDKIYFHDSHYDQYTTHLRAATLLSAMPQD